MTDDDPAGEGHRRTPRRGCVVSDLRVGAHRARPRRRRRHRPRAAARRGGRAGRRVRLRQDHRRHGAARLLPARRVHRARHGASSRAGTCSRCPGSRCARSAARRSPTCRRTRAPRSTRASGSAGRSSSCWSCAASAPPRSASRARGTACARSACPTTTSSWRRYPHQLSGGQVQRVALAMAFLPQPKVLVLDEPTTGLDVTTQGMVLQTMGELCRSHRVAALYVTHDLAVVANIADRVAVMYAGQIVELGPRDAMFRHPAHPYTRALLDAIPHLSPGPRADRDPRHARPGRGAARPPAGSTTRCEYVAGPLPGGRAGGRPGRPGPHREVPAGRRDRRLGHRPRQRPGHRPGHRRATSS